MNKLVIITPGFTILLEEYLSLEIGQVIKDRYRIDELLGKGGFGAVYRAWDVNLNEAVALKESLLTTPEAQRQFQTEARLLFKLRHTHLPAVHDWFTIEGQGQYLVMDYIAGEDLQSKLDRLGEGKGLPEAQVVPYILQVCEALAYLHNQEPPVIHRDIKPANIRINPKGQAVLVDFGIAKVYDPERSTSIGARGFTPGYSPPEQLAGGETDARSDIYALGSTVYHLLSGMHPPLVLEVIAGNQPPPEPAWKVNPHISFEVSAALERAMQPRRNRRYARIEEFAAALHSVKQPAPAQQEMKKLGLNPPPSAVDIPKTKLQPEEAEGEPKFIAPEFQYGNESLPLAQAAEQPLPKPPVLPGENPLQPVFPLDNTAPQPAQVTEVQPNTNLPQGNPPATAPPSKPVGGVPPPPPKKWRQLGLIGAFLIILLLGIWWIQGRSPVLSPKQTSTNPFIAYVFTTEPPTIQSTPIGIMRQLALFITQTAQAAQDQAQITPTPNDIMEELAMFVTQTFLASQDQLQTTPTPNEVMENLEMYVTQTAQAALGEPQITATPSVQCDIILPTATPGIPETHTIQSGEGTWCIARRFNVDPSELHNMNGLGTNSLIRPGMLLKIPQTGNQFPANRALIPHPDIYSVQSGDTIYTIACRYGDVSPEAIAYVNDLTEPYNLTAGQVLCIP